jgi:hypothetical protein
MGRGSRRHVLDWTESSTFSGDLATLVRPVEARVTANDYWMPRGHAQKREARLETFGPKHIPTLCQWNELTTWWLQRPKGANTPNWDIACPAEINGHSGLILVEAKANVQELSHAGKSLSAKASAATRANHAGIGAAIICARNAITPCVPGVGISRDHHYQLSNRIAFAWKLASLGVPTVLVYLGFVHSADFRPSKAYQSDQHWRDALNRSAANVWPFAHGDICVNAGLSSFWVLARSIDVG